MVSLQETEDKICPGIDFYDLAEPKIQREGTCLERVTMGNAGDRGVQRWQVRLGPSSQGLLLTLDLSKDQNMVSALAIQVPLM